MEVVNLKNIWIFNHYATDNYFNEGGRHYWFAEFLKKKGYNVTIFCANTRHNSNDVIDTNGKLYAERVVNEIPFVFVKSHTYNSNNHHRIMNMLSFSKRLLKVSEDYRKRYGKPDTIIASSVHPLTLIAGLKIAKKLQVKCIVEVRDLWPESIVAYDILSKNNPITQIMYQAEKKIYEKADAIIMTWQGGKDYIKNQGWFSSIREEKIHHISNGVVLKNFNQNADLYKVNDSELMDTNYKNYVYTGSIRKVNYLSFLVDVAQILDEKYPNSNIRILIYGDGDEKTNLEEKVSKLKLSNIIFKGKVHKKYVPFILKSSYGNILHNRSTNLDKYGQSQNKLFEYLAAGRPIIQTYSTGYSVIEKENCGYCAKNQTPEEVAKALVDLAQNENEARTQGENSKQQSINFDFENLTNKLIEVIER